MITITTRTASTDSITLKERGLYNHIDSKARTSRAKCLDGSTAFIHSGVSVGDEEITFSAVVAAAEMETINRLYRNYTELVFSTRGGVYLGFINQVKYNRFIVELTLWKKERLDTE